MFAFLKDFFVGREIKPIEWKEGNSDPHIFFKPVDDYSSREFARNIFGHPRSDVALLNEQSDMTQVNWLLDKLQQRKADGVGPEVSDKELSIAHKSKYCQSASEMIQYYENLLKVRDDAEIERTAEKDREFKAKELAERRAKLRESLTQEEREALRKAKRERELEELLDD